MMRKRRTSEQTTPTSPSPVDEAPETPPEPAEAPPAPGFPIVGIGASAGGLAAFEAFFSAMPADTENGTAFVLVQHLSPDHKSILSELIKRYTRMQVYEVSDGMTVQPNCAYIIPPNRDMALLNGTLQLLEPTAPRGLRMPIDFFFRSLAQDKHERAICIVLSGTGSDGTLGVRAIKGEGGMVMAQDPGTTEYDGMPYSAIATGLVDYVLPPAAMPTQLLAYVSHAFGRRPRPTAPPTGRIEDMLKKICVLLRAQTGHDFAQYKQNTLMRRVERRMALHQIERPEGYLRFLQRTPAEAEALFRDLLIGVTSFFRDAEGFVALQERAIPRLFAGKPVSSPVRVWVCGCSTGEEAYSIAILIQEYLDGLKQSYKVQIFATDVDRQAIEQARTGIFPASIATDVSAERLARFFIQESDGGFYRIQKSVRDLLIFSEQDVIKDPPFSKLDLISCRNLLIYMNGELQKKLIPLFHYALNPEGMLFLGPSETVGEFGTLFATLDRKWKLYGRLPDLADASRPVFGIHAPAVTEGSAQQRADRAEAQAEGRPNLRELTEQALLAHYAQSGVLINGRGEILYIYGRTGKFLEPAPGDMGTNILPMAREGLRRELTTALHKAVSGREMVRYSGLRVRTNGEFTTADLIVRPVTIGLSGAPLSNTFLVLLEETPARQVETGQASDVAAPPADVLQRLAQLEQELRSKDEYLQTTMEEMETSNEELKSTNEEMQSVNEELQSTNEELETSKEELQSVNEELATVNAELQTKVTDLSRANNDMNNLLAGTGIGTLFVDMHLRIARFTPAVTQVINLIGSDLGRPVGHIVSNLVGYDRLLEDIKKVLDTLVPCEAEVQTQSGAWYLMRIRPYRTYENMIEGAVLTFVDITQHKKAEEQLAYQSWLLASVHDAIIAVDGQLRISFWNPMAEKLFGWRAEEVLGKAGVDILETKVAGSLRDTTLQQLKTAGDFEGEVHYRRKDGAYFPAHTRTTTLKGARGEFRGLVSAIRDITELKRYQDDLEEQVRARTRDLQAEIVERTAAQVALQRSADTLAAAERIAHVGSWERILATNDYHWSDEIYRIFGLAPGDPLAIKAGIWNAVHPDDYAATEAAYAHSLQTGERFDVVYRIILPDGETRVVRGIAEVLCDASGQPERVCGMVQDITEQERNEEARRRMVAVALNNDDAITVLDLEGRVLMWNRAAERMYGWAGAEIVPDEQRAEVEALLGRLRAGEAIEPFETQRRTKDGRVRAVRLEVSKLVDENGAITALVMREHHRE